MSFIAENVSAAIADPGSRPSHSPSSSPAAPWQARLRLGFGLDGDTTRLFERSHRGPLRVQKPLYPESPAVCHAIVVHPPGGVVGGDQLAIATTVDAGAHAFITTPGAAKWYRGNGRVSRQQLHSAVAAGATLEWMPQETIFFDAAEVELHHDIELAAGAHWISCDILCFGRTASGESFRSGRITQRTRIRLDGKLIWFEQGRMLGGDTTGSTMHDPLGMAGKTVIATLLATSAASAGATALIQQIRDTVTGEHAQLEQGQFGISQLKHMIVARYLGDSSETARRLMLATWHQLRPALLGRHGLTPRIWNT